jgi:hypothetical protein
MARYDRQFDYGLRGFRESPHPRTGYGGRGRGYEQEGTPPEVRPNRVSARYNRDYVTGDRGERYPQNPQPYGGDREERVGDARAYREPYLTRGGTRTWRGSAPGGFMTYDRDFADYDRDYGFGGRGRP